MPTYEYRCLSCDHQFERFQRMSDDPVKDCEVCGAPVKRLLFPVAVHFKGSGFYSTEYGPRGSLLAGGANAANAGSSESSCTEGGASTDAAVKPAPKESSAQASTAPSKSD